MMTTSFTFNPTQSPYAKKIATYSYHTYFYCHLNNFFVHFSRETHPYQKHDERKNTTTKKNPIHQNDITRIMHRSKWTEIKLQLVVPIVLLILLPLSHGFSSTPWTFLSRHPPIQKSNHHHNYFRQNESLLVSATLLHASLISSDLPTIIETKQINLSTGINAEIMICKTQKSLLENKSPLSSLQEMIFSSSSSSKSKPPLIFIHGSFHASWCWSEKFFPYFAQLGYPCYAISLRGTGGTFAGDNVKRVNIMDHVNDFGSFLEYVYKEEEEDSQPPVIFAHSFGGLCIMKYLEKYLLQDSDDNIRQLSKLPIPLKGVCLMCSVPPSGNGKMTLRFLKRSLKQSWKITSGLALRNVISDEELCRYLFFDGNDSDISDEDIRRYQGYFKRDTVATINLGDLAKRLPSVNTDLNGKALFADNIPPTLVVGAYDDCIVDEEGVIETAKYFGVEPTFVESPHDVMLGRRWDNTAKLISQWLENLS